MITALLFVLQMTCDMDHRGDQAMGFSQHAAKQQVARSTYSALFGIKRLTASPFLIPRAASKRVARLTAASNSA